MLVIPAHKMKGGKIHRLRWWPKLLTYCDRLRAAQWCYRLTVMALPTMASI
jgi:hypothetical protein